MKLAVYSPEDAGLRGRTTCAWGDRVCNPCVADVPGAFNSLRTHGDILGFHTSGHPDAYTQGKWFENHWQGVQRLSSAGGRAFVVSLDHVRTASGLSAAFNTAWMGTREEGGARWRSNRLAWGADIAHTVPAASDAVYDTVLMPSDGYHPGGIQAAGDILAVGAGDQFYLYDMADPFAPDQIGGFLKRDNGKSSSTSAILQLSDGNHLVAVSEGDAKSLDFYRTTNWALSPEDLVELDGWQPHELRYAPRELRSHLYFFYDWDTFQNINLISECGTGDIYLVATSNLDKTADWNVQDVIGKPKWPNGEDWASLYLVQWIDEEIVISKVAERHFTCGHRGETYCNFDAAAGVYVDDEHQLLLYSTEHRNDGPQHTVKGMEFRPVPHGSCGSVGDGWLELYAGEQYNGRSLMLDWIDRDLENSENYDQMEDFEDTAASAIWCLPHDWTAILYEDKAPCGGREIALRGTGALRKARLDTFGDDTDTSCSRFLFDPPRIEKYLPQIGVTLVYYLPQGAAGNSAAAGEKEPQISLAIPPGALDEALTFTLTPQSPPAHDYAPAASAGIGFTLTAARDGAPLGELAFNKAASVTINYDPAQLGRLAESALALFFWDETAAAWTPASQTCAAGTALRKAAGNVTEKICRTGEYALLAERAPHRVLVDEMHDNMLSLSWARAQAIAGSVGYEADARWFYLNALREELAAGFDLVRAAGGSFTAAKLAGVDVLLIPPYRAALAPAEVAALRDFVNGGGGIVMLGESGYLPPNPGVAALFGVKHVPLALFGPAPDVNGDIRLSPTGGGAALPDSEGMILNWSQPLSKGAGASVVVRTAPDSWLDVTDDGGYDEGSDPLGAFNTALAYDGGCGRVVVFGDNAFADGALEGTENARGMGDLLGWAARGRPCSAPFDPTPKRVLLDEAHDAWLTLDWGRAQALAARAGDPAQPDWYYAGELETLLAGEFELTRDTAPLTAARLAGVEALILAGNSQALSAAEVAAVKNYVAGGGGLLLIGDCGDENPDPALAAAYGITFSKGGCLFSGREAGDPVFDAANYAAEPWLAGVNPFTAMYSKALALSGSAVSLLDTQGLDTWLDADGDWQYDNGEEGVFDLAAGYDSGCGRVAAVGDRSFADSHLDVTAASENDDLLRQLLRWVTDGRDCAGGGGDGRIYLPMLSRR